MRFMDILEAFDLTKTPHSAAVLAGCDEKTVPATPPLLMPALTRSPPSTGRH